MFLYGNYPSGPFFIFCIFVLALSKGRDIKEAKNPAIPEALIDKNIIIQNLCG
jgi:hypothetical protein